MDYQSMAEELMDFKSNVPQVEAEREMSKMLRGRAFVLNYLAANHNRAYPKNLSRSMMVSSARIAVLLRELEHEGIITRTTDAEDNRQIIVMMTEKGWALARQYRAELRDRLVEMLEYLGPEDAEAYLRIHKKLMQRRAHR